MDVVTLGMAKADAAKRYGRRLLPGPLPSPVCAGRVFRPSSASSLTGYTFQRVYQMYNDAVQVRLVFANIVMQGSPQENSYGSYTLKASIIWDYNPGTLAGTVVPVTFSGASSVTVGQYQILVSDPIDVSFATTTNSYFAVRSYVTQAGSFLPVSQYDPFGVNGWTEGYLTGDLTGSVTSFAGPANDVGFGPTAVIGWPSSNKNNATILIGDSIQNGTGFLPSNFVLGQGFGGYALMNGKIPAMNVSRSGELANNAITYSIYRYRSAISQGFKYAITEYGTNDVGAPRTYAQITADLLNHWKYLARRGLTVYQTTILPRNNTSNGWQTVAGQTLYAGSTQEGIRQQINTWLRAPASAGAGASARYDAAGALTGIFDTALTLEANTNGTAITIDPATGAISNGAGGYHQVDTTSYSSGTVTSIPSASKLADTTKAWATNQWTGYSVVIDTDTTTPAAVGQCVQISTNSATQLNLNANWTTTPSTAATYRIMKTLTTDGIHPSTLGHIAMAAAVDTTKLVAN